MKRIRPEKDELVRLYAQYRSVRGIARALQVDNSTVHKWMNLYGLSVQRRLKRNKR